MIGRLARGWVRTFAALARDKGGNALMLTAAAMIPLTGMVGGAVDLSRLYLTKVRLQHACDAGALAGRKAMGGGAWSSANQTTANQFFDGNFVNGAYGTGAVTRAYTQPNGGTSVHGTAQTTVPMTLMKVFAIPTQTITVTCDSDMQMPNTDVMFVLDNTGSMACDPNGNSCYSGSTSKIYNLKNAVKCFYEVLAQLKSNGSCTTTISGSGIPATTQLRFGFVPYTTNVNVGSLNLATKYFASTWPYDSRMPRWYVPGAPQSTNNTVSAYTGSNAYCNEPTAKASGYENGSDSYTTDSSSAHANTWTHVTRTTSNFNYNSSTGVCSATQTTTTTQYVETEKATPGANDVFSEWHYGKITHTLTGLVSGSNLTSSVTLPIGASGVSRTVGWDGCTEEMAATSNINTVANGQLGPALPDALFARAAGGFYSGSNYLIGNSNTTGSGMTTSDQYTTTDYFNGVRAPVGATPTYYFCPTASQSLQTWSTTAFDSYVDSLYAAGNTYHDVGMLWGGRLLSPEGIYASSNAATPTGGQIQRHLIFMTDGAAQATACDYAQFGHPWYDQRTDSAVGSASACSGINPNSALTADVNTRLLALCSSVKSEPNTILWVISYGGYGIDPATKTNLTNCATDSSHYFDATSNASLQSAFQQIASKIAQLRITG